MSTTDTTQATPNTDNPEENEFSMPEEFADDVTPTVPHTPASSPVASNLSEEELDEKGFNNDRDELERAKLSPPTGDWKKEDSWEYERQVFAEDCMPDDFDPAGRTFFIFKGKPVAREANGLSYEPALRLRISPDRRYKLDKPTEVDTAYKLFIKAKEIYLEKNQEVVSKAAQLRSMLQHDAYVVRTMNGDNGSIIVDLKLKSFAGRNSR